MPAMMATAAATAVLAGTAGLYLSYYARTAAGASIAGVLVAAYALALAALLNSPLAAAWLGLVAEPARGGYQRFLGWTMALLPLPHDWPRARASLAPLAERAIDGCPPSDATLLAATLDAYRLDVADVAPLLAWTHPPEREP
jgi:hypothetical protein